MVPRKYIGGLISVCVAMGFALGTTGCSDDLYTRCNLDESLECEQEDSANSCVSEPNFACSSQVCGVYEKSEAFCTRPCTANGDCPNGECRQFVLGQDDKYCVPSDKT